MCGAGRWVTGSEEGPPSPRTKPLHQLRYGVYGRLLSTCYSWRGSLALHLSFSLQNKKLNPRWVSLRGGLSSHLPLPLRPLGDTQPANPSSPPPLSVSSPPLTSLIFLPLMLKLTIAFSPPKNIFLSILPSSLRVLVSFLSLYPLPCGRSPFLRPRPVISLLVPVTFTMILKYLHLTPFYSLVFLSSHAARARSGWWENPGDWLLYEATCLNK